MKTYSIMWAHEKRPKRDWQGNLYSEAVWIPLQWQGQSLEAARRMASALMQEAIAVEIVESEYTTTK